jgi:hypothetical protein
MSLSFHDEEQTRVIVFLRFSALFTHQSILHRQLSRSSSSVDYFVCFTQRKAQIFEASIYLSICCCRLLRERESEAETIFMFLSEAISGRKALGREKKFSGLRRRKKICENHQN